MDREFHRIPRLPPYLFAEVNEMKARARAAGEDIVDFGMGNPDRPPPPHIVEKMVETARDPRAHRYSTSRGVRQFVADAEAFAQEAGRPVAATGR